jgi:hypothetical protein
MNFFQFLESKGLDNGEATADFLKTFLEDPSVFFRLSESERKLWENRMDQMLELFKD